MESRLTTYILMFAFFMQALIPVGFMPAFAKDGSVTIEICSGDSVQHIKMDADGDEADHQTSTKCPYAFANSYFTSSDVASLGLPVWSIIQDDEISSPFLVSLVSSAHSPRAPPFMFV